MLGVNTMLNDFEIITRHFRENNDIKIYPISDVHLGAAEHLAAEWDNFCKRILGEPNSYVILGGDLLNNSTRSSVANVFEETMRPREQKRRMAEMLKQLDIKSFVQSTGTTSGGAEKMQTMTQHMTLCASWIWSIFTGKTWRFSVCALATKKQMG